MNTYCTLLNDYLVIDPTSCRQKEAARDKLALRLMDRINGPGRQTQVGYSKHAVGDKHARTPAAVQLTHLAWPCQIHIRVFYYCRAYSCSTARSKGCSPCPLCQGQQVQLLFVQQAPQVKACVVCKVGRQLHLLPWDGWALASKRWRGSCSSCTDKGISKRNAAHLLQSSQDWAVGVEAVVLLQA